jgi:glycine/serine hydroxymethyltransferase
VRDAAHAKEIDAVFPVYKAARTTTTAAIAVALKEASTADFRSYGQQIKNAKASRRKARRAVSV